MSALGFLLTCLEQENNADSVIKFQQDFVFLYFPRGVWFCCDLLSDEYLFNMDKLLN